MEVGIFLSFLIYLFTQFTFLPYPRKRVVHTPWSITLAPGAVAVVVAAVVAVLAATVVFEVVDADGKLVVEANTTTLLPGSHDSNANNTNDVTRCMTGAGQWCPKDDTADDSATLLVSTNR